MKKEWIPAIIIAAILAAMIAIACETTIHVKTEYENETGKTTTETTVHGKTQKPNLPAE